MKEEIISRLESLPVAIQSAQEELVKLRDKSDEIDNLIRKKEQEIIKGVISEKEDNKPKFSNQQQRDIAADTRRSQDTAWVNLASEIKAIKNRINEQNIGIEFLNNKFSAAKTIARLIEAKE